MGHFLGSESRDRCAFTSKAGGNAMGSEGHATTVWGILETYDKPFQVTLYEGPSGKPCLRMHAMDGCTEDCEKQEL